MLHSQGQIRKQRPYDESSRVPLLIRYPAGLGKEGRKLDTLVNAPDLMPTLLGLCGVPVPDTAEGHDLSGALLKGETPQVDGALLMCAAPFGEWTRTHGGREYRGLRTRRYTYVRSLDGPWLLFDNEKDPYQKENLCGRDAYAGEQEELEALLTAMLKERGDAFLPAEAYVKRWGYTVDATGTVPVRE
jgi:arylsulfatase A-like enzyme